MDDQTQHNIMNSETSPSATISRTTNSSLSRRRRKNQSVVWNHFTLLPSQHGSIQQARCNYCNAILKCNNGTTSMAHHMAKCLKERNKSVSGPANADGNASASPSVARFDQENSRNLLVRMIIGMELPFQHVEHPFFHDFVSSLQPKFSVISRSTLVRDIFSRWERERSDLKKFMSQHCDRICLTADTWTSVQTLSYMSLTAHFIDNNWTLQKRVINFCQVPDTRGNTIATTIEACLSDWGLYRVLTVTLDNASANDVAINRLKRRYMSWDRLVLKGEYIHMSLTPFISDERTPKSRYGFDRFLQSTGTKSSVQSELSKYLEESFEPHTSLDILNWWKVNSTRFPILAKMARDLLAIPISTVPSESIFSTGGRVLNDYRSSLTPKMVEMIVCMDDWLKVTLKPSFGFDLFSFEDFQELEKLEEEMTSCQIGSSSASAAFDID